MIIGGRSIGWFYPAVELAALAVALIALAVDEVEAAWLDCLLGWWLLAAVACGLGILTKGPVALALLVPPLWVYRYLSGTCGTARRTGSEDRARWGMSRAAADSGRG